MHTVLTIAGSDSSGGAGIQADLKTFAAHHCYGMSAITALTAQNTTGVQGIHAIPPEFVAMQIDSVFDDIPPQAVKIGMTMNAGIVQAIAGRLRAHHAVNVVLDPVMVSTSGCELIDASARAALMDALMPLATIVTPNLPEAEVLCGHPVADGEEMVAAAREIAARYPTVAVLIKGGHLNDRADDLLLDAAGQCHWLPARRLDTKNTHGTGCTLSSAIAAGLARGDRLETAVAQAKQYVYDALCHDPRLGHGNGPLDHLFAMEVAR